MEDDEADLYEDLPARSPATATPVVSGRDLERLRKAAAEAAAADAGPGESGDSSDEDVVVRKVRALGSRREGRARYKGCSSSASDRTSHCWDC